ncbi:cyclic nucleotide-gated ion channel [Methylocystis heyeri]|nr:cyclic nucleotide-gated ion channel [Methylocystis heyeri]
MEDGFVGALHAQQSFRRRLYLMLDGAADDGPGWLLHRALIALVALSVGAVILESMKDIAQRYGLAFRAIEIFAVSAFTLEYLLRIWTAPEHTPYARMTPTRARLAFICSGTAIIDLFAILPAYLSFFLGFMGSDLRMFLLLRLLRFFKLARYSPGIRSLIAVIEAERRALFSSATLLFGVVLFAATAMHVAEHNAQPVAFGSIPASMWWAVQTIATVGYGDVTPITGAGRIIAALTMVTGFVMLGLPVGIVATAFAEEIHRREFVVTWSMVASVPLFRSLDASSVAEIMRCLRAQSVPAGTPITRRGEEAHSMYFIAAGQVEIELPQNQVVLGEGQFFGEIALLRRTRRSANVRALCPTKLLILDAFDLRRLMRHNPEIGKRIEEVAANRVDFTRAARQGDIIEAEIISRDDSPLEEEY